MESGKYNRNKEMLDDYIGYKLTTENSSQHSSFNLKGIVVAVLIIIGIAMIYDALRPKCAHSGCDNTPEEGSCYCLIHDPKYYNNKNSYTPVFSTATTSRPKTTTASSSATRLPVRIPIKPQPVNLLSMMLMIMTTQRISMKITMMISMTTRMQRIIGRRIIDSFFIQEKA
ncbi:hypothetical protein DXA02_10465 [Ruminococcus sp. AM54-1NS]|nr:hypothetical protein DXA02_10465 [Ruminococcus sp. AM54-1NS]